MSNGLRVVKGLVPARIRRAVKESLRERRLGRAVRRVAGLPAAGRPTREMLAELHAGWGNEGFAARVEYLEEVAARAAQARGPILECGSGLTSVLLGLVAGRRGVETWSLENSPEWRARVAAALSRHGVAGVRVCDAPLKSYGGFSWYDPPAGVPRDFDLVVCDGPPGSTEGGRYGLLPVFGGRLAGGAVILLDDAEREEEAAVLARWAREARLSVEMRRASTNEFAVVTVG